jgi:hypothetical protein
MFSLLNSAEALAPQKLEANAHLRFKRRGETFFISCNTKEPFGAIKQRLSQLVQRHHSEIQCYQYMTVQEKKEDMERRIEEKRRTAEEAVKVCHVLIIVFASVQCYHCPRNCPSFSHSNCVTSR